MIDKLKAEIFDLIHQQDILRFQYADIEKKKQEKLKLLAEQEKQDGHKLPDKS